MLQQLDFKRFSDGANGFQDAFSPLPISSSVVKHEDEDNKVACLQSIYRSKLGKLSAVALMVPSS